MVTPAPGGAHTPTTTPALYEVEVTHRRQERIDYGFTTRMYLWLVDLDALPRPRGLLAVLARFEAADHAGDPARPIRANIDDFLAGHGIDLEGGRVLMLAHARVLGYVFNPITLYWGHRPDGTLAAVVAEVHNTYGGRHRYLLDVDDAGRARVDKAFYVSPFFAVDGEYRMRVPEPDAALSATVVLRREGETRLRGHDARPAPPGRDARPAPRRGASPDGHGQGLRPDPPPRHRALGEGRAGGSEARLRRRAPPPL